MHLPSGFELTYCTNIHPAEGWPQVLKNLKRYSPELRARLSPNQRFGLGLRISNSEAGELATEPNLSDFKNFLAESGLYVALINGFPYGWFHERRLKDQVFAPDWHTEERVTYTLRLVDILSTLLPEDLDGGVSTCPLSYKGWEDRQPDWELLVQNIVRTAVAMFECKRRKGQDIHLDIEPEPDGLVETTSEFVQFFEKLLRTGAPQVANLAQLSLPQAEEALHQHVAFCYDLCHSAVEYERPEAVRGLLRKAGIRIGRVQVSSAVKVSIPDGLTSREELAQRLSALVDPVYLHQVIGDRDRYADLVEALKDIKTTRSAEWRIHYHVPLFIESYGGLSSTQPEVRNALAQIREGGTTHLEIETYTWSVLPPHLKSDLVDSIEREYCWVTAQL